jgi:subtilisin family serine protease
VAALDWVAANAKKPAVATLSLGIQVGSWSRVLEDAVRSLTTTYGVTVVVAAGNSGVDACYVAPANVPEVITVAATDLATKYNSSSASDKDTTYRWGNSGPCVDVFAPGVDIYSACGSEARCDVVDDESYTYASGTSMATPHVAGVAALYLQANPKAAPRDVSAAVVGAATQGVIDSSGVKQGTANRLLCSRLDAPNGVVAADGP